jgi:hypothetical protein
MEREVLLLLRYDLEVTNEEIWKTARAFMGAPWLELSKSERDRVRRYERHLTAKLMDSNCAIEERERPGPTCDPALEFQFDQHFPQSMVSENLPACSPEPSYVHLPSIPSGEEYFDPAPASSSAPAAIIAVDGSFPAQDPKFPSFNSAIDSASCTYAAAFPQVPYMASSTSLPYTRSSECVVSNMPTRIQVEPTTIPFCSYSSEMGVANAAIPCCPPTLTRSLSQPQIGRHPVEHECPHMKLQVTQPVLGSSSGFGNAAIKPSRAIHPPAVYARQQRSVDGCGHSHPVISHAARLKKKQSINAMQFHLPSGTCVVTSISKTF